MSIPHETRSAQQSGEYDVFMKGLNKINLCIHKFRKALEPALFDVRISDKHIAWSNLLVRPTVSEIPTFA